MWTSCCADCDRLLAFSDADLSASELVCPIHPGAGSRSTNLPDVDHGHEVIAWVDAHPGCTCADLLAAVEAGTFPPPRPPSEPEFDPTPRFPVLPPDFDPN